MTSGLENLCCEDRLGEFGLVSLENRRFWEDLKAAFQYLKGLKRRLKRNFSQGHAAVGQGRMVLT